MHRPYPPALARTRQRDLETDPLEEREAIPEAEVRTTAEGGQLKRGGGSIAACPAPKIETVRIGEYRRVTAERCRADHERCARLDAAP
jgi:hypothetical protein